MRDEPSRLNDTVTIVCMVCIQFVEGTGAKDAHF